MLTRAEGRRARLQICRSIGRVESCVQRGRSARQEHALPSPYACQLAIEVLVGRAEHGGAPQPRRECGACVKPLTQRVRDERLRRGRIYAPELPRTCWRGHRRKLVRRRRCQREGHLQCAAAGFGGRAQRRSLLRLSLLRLSLLRAPGRARRAGSNRPRTDLVDLERDSIVSRGVA